MKSPWRALPLVLAACVATWAPGRARALPRGITQEQVARRKGVARALKRIMRDRQLIEHLRRTGDVIEISRGANVGSRFNRDGSTRYEGTHRVILSNRVYLDGEGIHHSGAALDAVGWREHLGTQAMHEAVKDLPDDTRRFWIHTQSGGERMVWDVGKVESSAPRRIKVRFRDHVARVPTIDLASLDQLGHEAMTAESIGAAVSHYRQHGASLPALSALTRDDAVKLLPSNTSIPPRIFTGWDD